MRIRKGDTVTVLKGSDRSRVGEVLRVLHERDAVIVAGVNIRTMHRKPRTQGEKGSIVKKEGPINISNVAILDSKTKKPTRIAYTGTGRDKQRTARKSGTVIGGAKKAVKKAGGK